HATQPGGAEAVTQLELVEELLCAGPVVVGAVQEVVLAGLEDPSGAGAGAGSITPPALALVDQVTLIEHRLHRRKNADQPAARLEGARQAREHAVEALPLGGADPLDP